MMAYPFPQAYTLRSTIWSQIVDVASKEVEEADIELVQLFPVSHGAVNHAFTFEKKATVVTFLIISIYQLSATLMQNLLSFNIHVLLNDVYCRLVLVGN